MSFVTATLVALSAAVAMTTVLTGRPSRRPGLGPLVAANAPPPFRRWAIPQMQRANQVVRPASLAAWADDLAHGLRHGSTLHAALTHTLPADSVIEHRSASIRHWLGRGATVAEACDDWSAELSDQAHAQPGFRHQTGDRIELLATMSAVLAATASLGGAAAAPLDRFAVTMRQRASDDLERAAQSAQAKMSAKVLTAMPLGVLVLLLATDAGVRAIIASPAGGGVVALGLALNTLGALWMRRIAGAGRGPA
jgi:hypothetical protein